MIVIECEQNSEEWFNARLGIPTTSEFHRLVTPSKGELSRQADSYANEKVAEVIMGYQAESYTSEWMERGKETEEEAANSYALIHNTPLEQVGFVVNEERTAGCSPDRLVGKDGLLEIKCLKPANHVQALYDYRENGKVDKTYYSQIQGQLWITGRTWVDNLYYCPGMDDIIHRFERDEPFIRKLEDAVNAFNSDVKRKLKVLRGETYS